MQYVSSESNRIWERIIGLLVGVGAYTGAEVRLKGWQKPQKHFMIYHNA
jgi:hypothetical protein